MRNYLIITIAVFLISGCGKDKFETTPGLTFKSVNTTELHAEQFIRFTLSFTDKEGDISGAVYVQKVVPNCTASNFEQDYPVPVVSESGDMKGDIVLTFGYAASNSEVPNIGDPQCSVNDTATFRFVLRDKKGHASDTVTSPKIIIYK